ncbi:MAG: hypothetical protein ACLFOY_15095 [Desulfatibacillaceae bacterium]
MDWDREVEGLFEDLGEAEAFEEPGAAYAPGLVESLGMEQQRQDAWRVLLVDFACQMSRYIMSSRACSAGSVNSDITRLLEILTVLEDLPDGGGNLLIYHQGRGLAEEGTASQRYDYMVSLGPYCLDIPDAKAAVRRMGDSMLHVVVDFRNALKTLSSCQVNTVYMAARATDEEAARRTELALTAMSDYFCAMRPLANVTPADAVDRARERLVTDQKRVPDPNLTALAAVNDLQPRTVQNMVAKVHGLMRTAKPGSPLFAIPSVYQGIFAFKKLRDALVRPPVEINEVRWPAAAEAAAMRGDQAELLRLVASEFGNCSQESCRIVDTLCATDYRSMNAYHVLDRLELATDLLLAIEKTGMNGGSLSARTGRSLESAAKQVLGRLENRLKGVMDPVLDDISVNGDMLAARVAKSGTERRHAHDGIRDMVDFLKRRKNTREKLAAGFVGVSRLEQRDYEDIARDYRVPTEEAGKLVGLMADCFDARGRFTRKRFEAGVPRFARHPHIVFSLMWRQLAAHPEKQSRLDMLNCLRILARNTRVGTETMDLMVDEFLDDAKVTRYQDRNALLLSSLFLYGPTREMHQDITLTSPDVLRGTGGTVPGMTEALRGKLERSRERLFTKAGLIHSMVRDSLEHGREHGGLSVRFLLLLEWELYALLGLAGGETARLVVSGALAEYGNPVAEIYTSPDSDRAMGWLFPVLMILVRAIGRVGNYDDLTRLFEMRNKAADFVALKNTTRHKEQVRKLIEWTDASIRILEKTAKPPEDDLLDDNLWS